MHIGCSSVSARCIKLSIIYLQAGDKRPVEAMSLVSDCVCSETNGIASERCVIDVCGLHHCV